MVFGLDKHVFLFKILEAVVILLPLIYGLTIAGGDLSKFANPVYTPPEIGFSVGDVTSLLRNDTSVLNVSITNDGTLEVYVESFNVTLVYKNETVGEAHLEAPIHIASGEEVNILLVVDYVDLTLLLHAHEDEALDLRGNINLEMQGVQVSTPLNMTIQLKTLIDALEGM